MYVTQRICIAIFFAIINSISLIIIIAALSKIINQINENGRGLGSRNIKSVCLCLFGIRSSFLSALSLTLEQAVHGKRAFLFVIFKTFCWLFDTFRAWKVKSMSTATRMKTNTMPTWRGWRLRERSIREEGNDSDESDEESGEWAYQCSGQDKIHIQS